MHVGKYEYMNININFTLQEFPLEDNYSSLVLLINTLTQTWSQNQNLIKVCYFGERYFVQNIEKIIISKETWEEVYLASVNLFVI